MGPLQTFSKDLPVGRNKRAAHQRHMRTVTTVPLQPTRHIPSLSTPQGLTSAHRGCGDGRTNESIANSNRNRINRICHSFITCIN
jgi:hypothetical protein